MSVATVSKATSSEPSSMFMETESTEFNIDRPDHFVLTTADPDKIADFYTNKLNMTLKEFGEGRKALHSSNFKINIHKKGEQVSPYAKNANTGTQDFCLVCSCNVQFTEAHLKKVGVDIELGPCKRTGAVGPITSIYVRDPDGNLIELAHYQVADSEEHVSAGDYSERDTISDSKLMDHLDDILCQDEDDKEFNDYSEAVRRLIRLCESTEVIYATLSTESVDGKDGWIVRGEGLNILKDTVSNDNILSGYSISFIEDADRLYSHPMGQYCVARESATPTGEFSLESSVFCELLMVLIKSRNKTNNKKIMAAVPAHLILKCDERVAVRDDAANIQQKRHNKSANSHLCHHYMKYKDTELDMNDHAYFDYYVGDKRDDPCREESFWMDIALIEVDRHQIQPELKVIEQELQKVGEESVHPGIYNGVNSARDLFLMGRWKTKVYIGDNLICGHMIPSAYPLVDEKLLMLIRFKLIDNGKLLSGDCGMNVYVRSQSTRKLYRLGMFVGRDKHNEDIYHAILLSANVKSLQKRYILNNLETLAGSQLYSDEPSTSDLEKYEEVNHSTDSRLDNCDVITSDESKPNEKLESLLSDNITDTAKYNLPPSKILDVKVINSYYQ